MLIRGDVIMAISEDNKRISVKLTKEQYELIKKIATDKDRSVSNYIGYLVKRHLEEKKLGN